MKKYLIGFPGPTSTLRRFVYPYVAWQRLPDRFIKTTNVDRINRTEDIALGVRTLFKLGWSPEALSNQGDQLLGDAFISGNWYLSEYQLLNARLSFAGRFAVDDGHAEDVFLTAQTTYHWDHHERWGLIARVSYSYAHNLSDDQQLLIGGDSGLRGYPSRYQSGDRRFLVTFEERYYADIFPLRLFRLGFAAFVDIGRAWYEDDPPTWVPPRDSDHFGVLANIGLGLRIESVRTRRDRVIHIDIAKPLVDGPGVGSTELTITVKRAI
ncbi:MAG: hypothetical protein O7G86_15075 [Gammaproteobacteria bacterium]|nr:hypothetical protein [Gammaproteobacteria bacterium]